MKVLILAAGYGTRLQALGKDMPKPLLPVADKPLINHLLDKIADLKDFQELIVVTNEKFFSHFQEWAADNQSFPAPIKIINDGTTSPDNRLGSVGDIHFVLQNHGVKDDLLVIGGDNLFDYSLRDYVQFADQRSPNVSIGLYDIGNIEEAAKFGCVGIDSQGKVVSFEEKPLKPKSSLIAMCCYYFPQQSLALVSKYLKEKGKADKAGDYIHWLSCESDVYGFKFQGKWYDIGSIESYQEAQEKFKK